MPTRRLPALPARRPGDGSAAINAASWFTSRPIAVTPDDAIRSRGAPVCMVQPPVIWLAVSDSHRCVRHVSPVSHWSLPAKQLVEANLAFIISEDLQLQNRPHIEGGEP